MHDRRAAPGTTRFAGTRNGVVGRSAEGNDPETKES